MLMVFDLLPFVLSGSTEEPDSTNISKAINIRNSSGWVNYYYTHTIHTPRSLRSLTPSKGGKRALTDLVVGQVAHFNLTPETSLC